MGCTSSGINPYINATGCSSEASLWNDLVQESIQTFGMNMYYCPRKTVNFDQLTGTDELSKYDQAIQIELYIKSVDGFSGDGVFMSKFGLQIRDQVTFTVAKQRFEETIGAETGQFRPNEGDVIYFPLNKKVFVIRYVDYKPFFYQHGQLMSYDMICENFEYSSEEFSTGIADIDKIQTNHSLNIIDYAILAEDGTPILTEDGDYLVSEDFSPDTIDTGAADNDVIQNEANNVMNWEEKDPFSEGGIY